MSSKKQKKDKFLNQNDYEEKRLLLQLDNEQIEARQKILENNISVLIGKAGSGKTALACFTALKLYLDGKVDQIIVTRPMVSSEDLGSLPGSLCEKYAPWIIPLVQNFQKIHNPSEIKYMLEKEVIQMMPLQFTRGITYDHACVIVDEAQNCTTNQLKMVMSRVGEGSTLILTGDLDQIDLKKPSDSGLMKIKDFDVEGFTLIELYNEHRSKIVIDILEAFKKIGY